MRLFDEMTRQDLRGRPLSRREADELYVVRRRLVVLSDLGLIALAAAWALVGFAPWYVVGVVAALALCLLPLTLHVFRRERAEQVRAVEEQLGKSSSTPGS